jgi:hypothetical protein
MTRDDRHHDKHPSAPHPSGPGDARLASLLDEALGPVDAPADLADRIVAVTQPMLPGRQPARRSIGRRRAVLARLGPTLLAAAAMVAVGVGVATWMDADPSVGDPVGTGVGTSADRRALTSPNWLAVVEPEPDVFALLDELAVVDGLADEAPIDAAIAALAMQVDLVDWRGREAWLPARDDIEDAALLWELDALTSDPLFF